MISGAIYFFIAAAALVGNFVFVYQKNLGGSIVLNDEFYAQVFQNPLF
jgi:hypothetical protein